MTRNKFFRESVDFAENLETWLIFRETRSNEVNFSGSLRFLGNFSRKFGRYSRFSGGLLFSHGFAQTAFVRAVIPVNQYIKLFTNHFITAREGFTVKFETEG